MKKINLMLSAFTLFGLLSFSGCDDKNSTSESTLISSTQTAEKHNKPNNVNAESIKLIFFIFFTS